MILTLALILAAGCSGPPPERLADCGSASCQEAWAEAHIDAAPDEAMAQIVQISDPVALEALVLALSRSHPDQLRRRCGSLPMGPARSRCDTLNVRPHLWQSAAKEESAPEAGEPGVAGSDGRDGTAETRDDLAKIIGLVPASEALVRWEDVTPERLPCDTDPQECQTRAASARAETGDLRAVAAACLALEEGAWRDECFFKAGEHAAATELRGGLPTGATLCLSAPRFASQCLLHLTWKIAENVPDASASGAAWEPAAQGVEAAYAVLEARDAALARSWRDRAWANGLRASYERALPVTGDPLDHLPAEAIPHVTCAAAWRLWNLEAQDPRRLAQWTATLQSALEARATKVTKAESRRPSLELGDLWGRPLPGEEAISSVSWLGTSTRALGADARGEAVICMMEAAARDKVRSLDLLVEGLRDPDPMVRWTAVRLMQANAAPSHRYGRVARDADPLVQARAKGTFLR